MRTIQKFIQLSANDCQYHNFFAYEFGMKKMINDGWIVKVANLNEDRQCGWILFEKIITEEELKNEP